jgi:hypothetical protein
MAFSESDLKLIESMAEGLAELEICDYFGIDAKELSAEDRGAFIRAYRRGRTNIKHFALTKLKEQCSGRNGLQASLSILTQFGTEWERAGEMANVKSFKIVLED